MHWAASNGNLSEVIKLLDEGANIDPTDDVSWFYILLIYFLIINNLNFFCKIQLQMDQLGWTPLMIAVSGGHLDIAKVLIERGAEVNHSNDNGQIALHYAASKGRLEMMELLIQNRSKLNTKDKYVKFAFNFYYF